MSGKPARRSIRLVLVLVSMIFTGSGEAATGKLPPDLNLETVHTSHFRVHYPTTHRRFTAYLVAYLEEAYGRLTRDLQWQPSGKIEVLVRSDTDVPNGFAQVFPFNRLVIHAVPFQTHSFVGEYDNWIRTLAYHELTHVIANDTTSGFFRVLRWIFGSAAKVNHYQPQWLIEGLAVYYETYRSSYGRGRSNWMDAHFRTAALNGLLRSGDRVGAGSSAEDEGDARTEGHWSSEKRLLDVTLDRLNDGVPIWPGPNTPYLYGYLLNEIIAEKAGEGAPGELSRKTGSRVPLFVNTLAEKLTGQSYPQLWSEVVERLKMQAEEDLRILARNPLSPSERLSRTGRFSGGAAFREGSPWIFYPADSFEEGPGVSALNLVTKEERLVKRWPEGGGSRLRLDPSGGTLFYSRYHDHGEFRYYSEVFALDPDTGREVKLTSGARALDPDPSPDLQWNPELERITRGSLVYVKNLPDGNQAIAKFDGADEVLLFKGRRFERLSYPVWGRGSSRDWIFHSVKVNGGSERIQAVHSLDRRLRSITPFRSPAERANEVTPTVTSSGDLLYAASTGGVYNIHEITEAELSRVLSGGGAARGGGRDNGATGGKQSAAGRAGEAHAGGNDFPISRRITHLATGAIFPRQADHPDQLYVSLYGAKGFDLALVQRGGQEGSPGLTQPLREKFLQRGVETPEISREELRVDYPAPVEEYPEGTPKRYSIFPAIWPKHWVPAFRLVPDGYQGGLSLSGMDALERHRYEAAVAKDSRANFPVFSARYLYDGFHPTLEFQGVQENRYLSLYQESNRSNQYVLRSLLPVKRSWIGVGGTLTESKIFGEREKSGGFELRFYRSDFRRDPDSIDSEGEVGYLSEVNFTNYFAARDEFSALEARGEVRFPSLIRRHFFRVVGSYAASNNDRLSAMYFLGGGQANITDRQPYLLRGYQAGSIYGRKIATLNTEYWMPLAEVFRGSGTFPLFLERTKLRAFLDTGSAEYVALGQRRLGQWPVGAGLHLLTDLNAFYRVPVTVAVGFDWGFREELGGEKQFVFGLYSRVF